MGTGNGIGKRGELSKIDEEVQELKEAVAENNKILSIIECADVIESACQFARKQYLVPALILIALYGIRCFYKPVRNLVRDMFGLPKTYIKRNYWGEKYKVPKDLCDEFDTLQSRLSSLILYSRDSEAEDRVLEEFDEKFERFKVK